MGSCAKSMSGTEGVGGTGSVRQQRVQSSANLDLRTRLGMRKNLHTQATDFARNQSPEYELILLSPAATDPMNIETEPLPVTDEIQPDLQLNTPPRGRWAGVYVFLAAAFCDSLTIGAPSAIMVYILRYSSFGIGLALSCIAALVCVVVPLVGLEHFLGQIFQGGVVKAFTSTSRKSRSIGFAATLFLIARTPLYTVSMAESLLYLGNSFQRIPPWLMTGEEREICFAAEKPTDCDSHVFCTWALNDGTENCKSNPYKKAEWFYNETIIGTVDEQASVHVHTHLCIALAVGLLFIGLIAFLGLAMLGQLATFTSISSLIFFFFLTLITMGLRGSSRGFWRETSPDGISFCTGLAVFPVVTMILLSSFGVVFGNQYTLSSYNSVSANVVYASPVIIFLRSAIVILFAITTVCLEGYSLDMYGYGGARYVPTGETDGLDAFELLAGKRLVYLIFPLYLGLLSASPIYCIVFYLLEAMLAMLTVCVSIFAFRTAFQDTERFSNCSDWVILPSSVVLIFTLSLPLTFVFPDGNNVVLTEKIISSLRELLLGWATPIVAFFQIFAATWGAGWLTQKKKAAPYGIFLFNTVAALIVGTAIMTRPFATSAIMKESVHVAVYLTTFIFALPVAYFFRKKRRRSYWQTVKNLLIGDVEVLRHEINGIVAGPSRVIRLPVVWGILVKFVAPWSLVMVLSEHIEMLQEAEGPKWRRFCFGIVSGVAFLLCMSGVVLPSMWSWLRPSKENQYSFSQVPHGESGPRCAIRRLQFRPWEEFQSPESLWNKSFDLEFAKLM